jgi:hypothetical protein
MPAIATLITATSPFEHLKVMDQLREDDEDDNSGISEEQREEEAQDGGYSEFILQFVSPCLVSLALCVGKDILWKPLNHQVLMATRNPAPMVRLAALKTLHKLFVEVGEEYLILLPECLPFLSELMEDDASDVIDLTSEVVRYIEELSGEKLSQYLR